MNDLAINELFVPVVDVALYAMPGGREQNNIPWQIADRLIKKAAELGLMGYTVTGVRSWYDAQEHGWIYCLLTSIDAENVPHTYEIEGAGELPFDPDLIEDAEVVDESKWVTI